MSDDEMSDEPRKDVVTTQSPGLAEAILAAIPPAAVRRRGRTDERSSRMLVRKSLLEPRASDPNGFERVIGESDLLSINFLDRGRRAADAVCRVKAPADGGAWYGTAFLVGPRLLLTNHHVLANADEASQAEAEFGYEHDLDGVLRPPVRFNLAPHELFYSDPELDITFVGVAPLSDEGAPLTRFGRLPMLPVSGKAVDGEWVSIIQHPGGEPKQIAIQASQIIVLDPAPPGCNLDCFIHYSTDTEPGSSGAPVLNDQWQVLALHHKAVPDPRQGGESGGFIANEGVRVSAIFQHLEQRRFTDATAALVLDRLEMSLGLSPMSRGAEIGEGLLEADRAPLKLTHWADANGYDVDFLSARIDLDPIFAPALARGEVAPLKDGSGHVLKYHHYSSVIRADRKFPLFTAVNIDGRSLIHPGKRKNTWRRDARIADEFQPAGNLAVIYLTKQR